MLSLHCSILVKKATLQPKVIKVEKVSGTEEGQVTQGSNEDKAIVLTL